MKRTTMIFYRKEYSILIVLLLAVSILNSGCDQILNSKNPNDIVNDEQLNTASQVQFLIKGVETRFAQTLDVMTLQAGGLSDELFFDNDVQNATFTSYKHLNQAKIPLDQGDNWSSIGELRFFSDDLLRRVEKIQFNDDALKEETIFKANFFGGIARYFYGIYFGIEPKKGGGVIDGGPFIPSNEMFTKALDKLKTARDVTNDAYNKRLVNTIMARINLIMENYEVAKENANNGLVQGDNPLETKYKAVASFGSDLPNAWYYAAGQGRTQFVVDFRFHKYIQNNPQEKARIPLKTIVGHSTGTTYYYQNKYPEQTSGIKFAKWQENNLILAEISVRANEPSKALSYINEVRASHGIDQLSSVNMDTLIVERDKELFCEGHRLYDERRFNMFHQQIIAVTDPAGAGQPIGPWRYFPIPNSERDANENL